MGLHISEATAAKAWNTRTRVSSFAVLAITTAYEQGVAKGREYFHTKRAVENPYARPDVYRTHQAWRLGFSEGVLQGERAARCPGAKVENTGSKAWKLRKALQQAHDWMDSQYDSQSKGNHKTFDMMMLREQRDAIAEALK